MKRINTIYGVLVNSDVKKGNPCFRFSNVGRSYLFKPAAAYLDKLLPDTLDLATRAVTADTLIRLLQSSDEYEHMMASVDPVNTYDIDCIIADDDATGLSFDVIYKWAVGVPFTTENIKINKTDDPITTVQKALWIILSVK